MCQIPLARLVTLEALRRVSLGIVRAGERAGRLAERLSTSETIHEIQRQMLDAASRRHRDPDALVRRMRDGRF
jgi:hypothetical protein